MCFWPSRRSNDQSTRQFDPLFYWLFHKDKKDWTQNNGETKCLNLWSRKFFHFMCFLYAIWSKWISVIQDSFVYMQLNTIPVQPFIYIVIAQNAFSQTCHENCVSPQCVWTLCLVTANLLRLFHKQKIRKIYAWAMLHIHCDMDRPPAENIQTTAKYLHKKEPRGAKNKWWAIVHMIHFLLLFFFCFFVYICVCTCICVCFVVATVTKQIIYTHPR